MSYANVGKVWVPETFGEYLSKLKRPTWCKYITIHHTAAPSLAQRPKGFTAQHIVNIKNYYSGKLGWSRGPHLFTDEDQIFGMTPLTSKGIHARSFNSNSIGIEVLGNYDVEDPKSGRGLECWKTTAACTKDLANWLGITPSESTIKFHRDDPRTSKSCPGRKVSKSWFLSLVNEGYTPKPQTEVEFVNVVDYLTNAKGMSYDDVIKKLSTKRGLVYFGDLWLENTYYSREDKATYASKEELDTLTGEDAPRSTPYGDYDQ